MAEGALSPAPFPSGDETVLLVEDDDAVRAVAGRTLKRLGYCVLAASGGHEALKLAQNHPETIHLLLTDIMMPGMNGVELSRKLAVLLPNTRVLFMSGYADQDLIREGLLEPGTSFLAKPFTPQELGQKIRNVLMEAKRDGL